MKLFLERACINVRKESFSLRVTKLWNDLPEVVVTASSVNSFKNHLDKHWSTEEFLYNYKAALPGSRGAFQGKLEDLTTEATAYGQFNLVKALQLCYDMYFVDKKHSQLYRVGECFGQEINTCIQSQRC